MNKIKMIAFDLDGTLLTTDKKLKEYTRNVLERVMKKGIEVVPATGRPMMGVPPEIFGFPGIRYIVTSNGARVIERGSKKTLYSMLLSYESAKEILAIFREYDTMRDVFYDGQGYTEGKKTAYLERYISNPAMAGYLRASRIPVDDIDQMFSREHRAVDKVQALFADPKEREEAFLRLKKLSFAEPSCSVRNNIEVNGAGVHKGIALRRLGERLKITSEEIMAFGDGVNDIRMLQEAGRGIAMANAVQEVKDAADDAALSNDEEGVAKYIEDHVLG